ncbi:MAG: adenylosuccinate synthase [Oscillospiraceae bacterium]|jgi:adenylosuccinate synthase|nr:adenylosuccinate synthase [Oscillospiraceae bacterium]
MSVKVIVGAQFGDEGKGKVVDYLAKAADMVVRFQGGDNAGHTVMNECGTFKLHLIPCGIFNKECVCLIGNGTAVNPDVLIEEIQMLRRNNISVKKLFVSSKAQVVMPYHVTLDVSMEKKAGIGTTKRGIGWCYADKFLRKNFRMSDLSNPECRQPKLHEYLPLINAELRFFGAPEVSEKMLLLKMRGWSDALSPLICDEFSLLHGFLNEEKNVLFEGQLGVMKDIDLGIYPYVTSSNPVAAYAAVSGGFPASKIGGICGVAKAFVSAVGDGPFPTEMSDEKSAALRGDGTAADDEYGARTGRARRLGWFDIPMLKYAHAVNGFTEIALTKLDKLDTLDTIKICTSYMLNGEVTESMPDTNDLYRIKPIFKEFEGWMQGTSECKSFEMLPRAAKAYIQFIEQKIGVPIRYIGNGPFRENIITR